MEFDEVLNTRRSIRAYTKEKVSREQVAALMAAAAKAPVSCNLQVTQFLVIDDEALLQELAKKVSYKFAYSPCSIVVLYDPRVTVERHSVVSSTGMAVQNIMLKATEMGLGTIAMAGFRKDGIIKKLLGIPDELVISLIVAVGHIDPSVAKIDIPKIPLEQTYCFNTFTLPLLNVSADLKDHSTKDLIDYRGRIGAVYLDRYRLNSWNPLYYEKIADHFMQATRDVRGPHLDVLSYDGYFLRCLKERGFFKDRPIITADYLPFVAHFLAADLGASPASIDEHNAVRLDKRVGSASLIFQLQFIREQGALLKSIHERLEGGGMLYLVVMEEPLIKRVARHVRSLYRKFWRHKLVNIYEGNPFNKVGPIEFYATSAVLSMVKHAGFSIVDHGTIPHSVNKENTLRYVIARA